MCVWRITRVGSIQYASRAMRSQAVVSYELPMACAVCVCSAQSMNLTKLCSEEHAVCSAGNGCLFHVCLSSDFGANNRAPLHAVNEIVGFMWNYSGMFSLFFLCEYAT